MTTDRDEQQALKPCWCRTETGALSVQAHMAHGDFGCRERGRYVYCSNCWACGPTYNTDAEAITGWNRSRASIPAVEGDAKAQRRLQITLGYIKRAANRELPKLPCRVDEMTEREVAIFNVGAAAVGNLQFIARELDALPDAAASSSLPAEKLTLLQQAMVEHDDDMARLDRNTTPAEPPSNTWATIKQTCGFCRQRIEHVCTAFLKDAAPAEPVQPQSPRCPKCGYVMCQQFDSRPVNAIADIATPNGEYICYHCTPVKATGDDGETVRVLSLDELNDLCETLEMAAGDLDTEGLGDTDSCIFARKWIARLRGERVTS